CRAVTGNRSSCTWMPRPWQALPTKALPTEAPPATTIRTTMTGRMDGHHIRHWADGGATRLSNLVLLCRHHHRQVHEGRVEVRMLDDGALRFQGPDGRAFEAAPGTRGDSRGIVRAHRCEG